MYCSLTWNERLTNFLHESHRIWNITTRSYIDCDSDMVDFESNLLEKVYKFDNEEEHPSNFLCSSLHFIPSHLLIMFLSPELFQL